MKKNICLLFLMLLISFFSKYIYDAGVFKDINNENYFSSLNCKEVGEMQGPEDLALFDGNLLISSGYHKPFFKNTKLEGSLYYLNLEDSNLEPIKLSFTKNFYFNPHGIDVYKVNDNEFSVLAINHRDGFDVVEKFKFSLSDKKLVHIKSIGLKDNLKSLNDIVFIDENSFFVSEESKFKKKWLRNIFKYLRFGTGRVLYFKSDLINKSFSRYFYTNGLSFDKENSQLFVAEMLGLKVSVYNWKSEELIFKKSFEIKGGPDNIFLDSVNKRLFVAAHPKIFSLKSYSEDIFNKSSPSQLSLLDLSSNSYRTELATSELSWSGVSLFLPYKDKLILGNIFSKGIGVCDLPIGLKL